MLIDLLAATYIASCFAFKKGSPGQEWTVVFSRGAFKRDIPSLGAGTVLVRVGGEWLRRFFRMRVPDGWLEQVICLSYRDQLRAAFPLSIRMLARCLTGKKVRLLYGGVDYFEVAIFADTAFYSVDTRIEAVFHENYAISYVKNLTGALYQSIAPKDRILFSNLYTYGPPATDILHDYTVNPGGPQPMTMPRLASMEDDGAFEQRMAAVDDGTFAHSVLLLAFPGTDYLAPICFTATLIALAEMGEKGVIRAIVKFKHYRAAAPSKRQLDRLARHVQWVCDGSVEELAWHAGFTVVYNSISLYEALLGPGIVIVPAYLDALHDENILQESRESVRFLCGELQSVRFADSLPHLREIVTSLDAASIKRIVRDERAQRKALVRRKFYLDAAA